MSAGRVDVAGLVARRAGAPHEIGERWVARRRGALLAPDGRSLIIAADHPARGALGVRGDPMRMASRADLLERLATALTRPGVDGVLGTADILEELLLLGLLDDLAVVGSMNRAGLQGAAFESALRHPCARGLVVGRALLYPAEGDVAEAVDVAARLVHGGPR